MIAIWVALSLALVIMFLGCGWMLLRKGLRLLAALGDLFAAPAILDGVHRAAPEPRPQPSVLAAPGLVAAEYAAVKRQREERRLARHVARLDRARALITAKVPGLN